jgi:hypothetical protein
MKQEFCIMHPYSGRPDWRWQFRRTGNRPHRHLRTNKKVKIQGGYSHFFASDYLVDTGPHSDADFVYLMTTFSY